jgi:hypothetical protein
VYSSATSGLQSTERPGGNLQQRAASATASGVAAAGLGCWLLMAPFALGYGPTARWNGIFVGTLVLAFGALLGLLGVRVGELSGPLGALAVWLVVAPFVLDYDAVARWNDRAAGSALLLLAFTASPVAESRR